jgi:hypothetical protein
VGHLCGFLLDIRGEEKIGEGGHTEFSNCVDVEVERELLVVLVALGTIVCCKVNDWDSLREGKGRYCSSHSGEGE